MPRQNRPNTKKQQRRLEAERKTRRTRMYLLLSGVVLIAVIAVVILISANQPPQTVGEFTTIATQEWPQQSGSALGPADAPVVVEEFADFQCPFCMRYNESVQPQLIEEYVKTGKVRYEYHHFIVIDGNVGGSESRQAAEASECAAAQNRFWDYHEILFANQGAEGGGAFSDVRLKAFAEALGLDMQQFNTCFDSNQTAGDVTADEAQARAYRLNGTPSLLVNGQLVSNPMDYNEVKAAIDAALAGASQ